MQGVVRFGLRIEAIAVLDLPVKQDNLSARRDASSCSCVPLSVGYFSVYPPIIAVRDFGELDLEEARLRQHLQVLGQLPRGI